MQAKHKKRIYLGLALLLAVLLAIEVCFAKPHHNMIWNLMPGADILLGFGGGWLLILLAKGIMTRLQQRREDYYDRDFAGGSDGRCTDGGQCPGGSDGRCPDGSVQPQAWARGKGGEDHE